MLNGSSNAIEKKQLIVNWDDEIKTMEGWHFGGKGSGLEDCLADLVIKGIKTATCGWLEADQKCHERLPEVGDRSYIMNSTDEPVCVVETTEVVIRLFLEVDAQFAFDEGEGDRSYEYWRKGHESFFAKEAAELGLKWDSSTQHVYCERFRVVHVF